MTNQDDRWLWFIDDAPLQALLKAEGELGTSPSRFAPLRQFVCSPVLQC